MKIKVLFFSLLTVILMVQSCEIENTELDETLSFIKIYDFNLWGGVFQTLNVVQTTDNGYLVYANLEDSPYLMKVDNTGVFEWHTWDFSIEYPNYLPIRGLSEMDNKFLFVAENYGDSGKPIALYKISENEQTPQIIADFGNQDEITRVYSSLKMNNNLIILAALPLQNKTWIMCVQPDGELIWEKYFDYSPEIGENYPAIDRRFHFSGKIDDNTFFCNTYKDNDIAALIMDIDGNLLDKINFDYPVTGLSFATDKYAYSYPIWDIYGIQTDNSKMQTENSVAHRDPSFVKHFEIDNSIYAMFSANARDNMIMLKVFDPVTNNTIYKKYYGHTYFYNAGGMIKTADNGLLLFGNAYVLGRQGRILLIKISEEELIESVKQ